MELLLVEKNISSLEDWICVETNTAFIFLIALHLEEMERIKDRRKRERKKRKTKNKQKLNRMGGKTDSSRLFFFPPTKRHFHFYDSLILRQMGDG